jgi:hypothetical protein
MAEWTLFVDESGNVPERVEASRSGRRAVGGVLVPLAPDDARSMTLRALENGGRLLLSAGDRLDVVGVGAVPELLLDLLRVSGTPRAEPCRARVERLAAGKTPPAGNVWAAVEHVVRFRERLENRT